MPNITELKNSMRARAGMYDKIEPANGTFGGGKTGGVGTSTQFVPKVPLSLTWDYVQNTPLPVQVSFTNAYANAKKQGLKEFVFNGRPIAIVDSPNPKYTKRSMRLPL